MVYISAHGMDHVCTRLKKHESNKHKLQSSHFAVAIKARQYQVFNTISLANHHDIPV